MRYFSFIVFIFLFSCRRYNKEKKEDKVEPEVDPERDQRTVFAYQVLNCYFLFGVIFSGGLLTLALQFPQISLKAGERDLFEFFSRAGKVSLYFLMTLVSIVNRLIFCKFLALFSCSCKFTTLPREGNVHQNMSWLSWYIMQHSFIFKYILLFNILSIIFFENLSAGCLWSFTPLILKVMWYSLGCQCKSVL